MVSIRFKEGFKNRKSWCKSCREKINKIEELNSTKKRFDIQSMKKKNSA